MEKYNGWESWENWVIYNWVTSDEDLYNYFRGLVDKGNVKQAIDEAIDYARKKEGRSFNKSHVRRRELKRVFLEL